MSAKYKIEITNQTLFLIATVSLLIDFLLYNHLISMHESKAMFYWLMYVFRFERIEFI